jgi:hypothetical protein
VKEEGGCVALWQKEGQRQKTEGKEDGARQQLRDTLKLGINEDICLAGDINMANLLPCQKP